MMLFGFMFFVVMWIIYGANALLLLPYFAGIWLCHMMNNYTKACKNGTIANKRFARNFILVLVTASAFLCYIISVNCSFALIIGIIVEMIAEASKKGRI